MTQTSIARGPVRTGERALAPDLARGAMLLLIVLANTPFLLFGSTPGTTSFHAATPAGPLDAVVQFVIITAVDMRVYPMFAFLFGYGIVQLYRRQTEAGTSDADVRRLLRRRHLWLIVFGLVHAALLWMGDVLGTYGLLGLIITAIFFRRKDRTLLIWAAVLTSILVVVMVAAIVFAVVVAGQPMPPGQGGEVDQLGFILSINREPNYLLSILLRLSFWPVLVLIQGILSLTIPIAMLLAFWAGRQRLLERAADHLSLLRRVAVIGILAGWTAGAVHALKHLGVLSINSSASGVFSVIVVPTGLFCALGYIAVFGLLAERLQRRGLPHGVVVTAVTALGQRSLSGYLAQSVLCAPVLSAWGLGLGAWMTTAPTAGFAVAVWLVTLVAAALLQRANQRGPAEILLRRLSYGKPSTT